jgi:hypothetical protein
VHAISDAQRRARLGVRHALAAPVATVEAATEAVTCLHATEPASVYLAAAARTHLGREAVSAAMYDDRTVVKQLAMRRTLFGFPRDLLPAVWGSASQRVAGQLAARLAKEVAAAGLADDGAAWVKETVEAVLDELAAGPATTAELRERIPAMALRLEMAPGKSYGGVFPIGPRVLSTLAADGRVLRGSNEGDWRTSRPRWCLTEDWLGAPAAPLEPHEGYAVLVGRWLRSFGPGTETDLVWWLGATKGAVRRALADLEAVEVALDDGGTGWVLPDDLDDVPPPEPWAALLPVLDPTTMGWKQRDFYLDPGHVPHLFDTNGNGGSTAWWNGRVVGCWVQDPDGVVRVATVEDVGADADRALAAEAERLTAWLAGDVVATVYPSRLMRDSRP